MIRSFSTAITSDPVFTRRSAAAQLLYFRLYMHPGNHLCGLFMYSAEHMAVDLKTTSDLAANALAELATYGFAMVDTSLDLVWIPEMAALIGDVSAPRHPIGSAIVKYLRGLSIRQSTLIDRVASTLRLTLGTTLVDTLITRDLSVSVSDPGSVSGSDKPLAGGSSPAPRDLVENGQTSQPGDGKPRSGRRVAQDPGEQNTGALPPADGSDSGGTALRIPSTTGGHGAGHPVRAQGEFLALVPTGQQSEKQKRTKRALAARADEPPTRKTWEAYSNAYARRYGPLPTSNRKVFGQLAQLVGDMGAVDAPQIAEFYLTRGTAFYVTQHHPIGLLLRDAQGLRTEMLTGRTVNAETARQEERTEANPGLQYLEELRKKEKK